MIYSTSILLVLLASSTNGAASAEHVQNRNLEGGQLRGNGKVEGQDLKPESAVGYTEWESSRFNSNNKIFHIDESGHRQLVLENGFCSVWANDNFFDTKIEECLDADGKSLDGSISYIRSTSNTCIEIFDDEDAAVPALVHCGDEWLQLDEAFSKSATRVCCIASESDGDSEMTQHEDPQSGDNSE